MHLETVYRRHPMFAAAEFPIWYGGDGIDVRGPNLTDLGRNRGAGNGSLVVEPQVPVQCQVNGASCR